MATVAELKAQADAHYERMYSVIGEHYGLNEKQHSIVYAQAWEQGHSSGFGEVEGYYEELAEMARDLIEAR